MLLSVIAGTETPGDVAAIMSWFHDNPDLLAPARKFGAGSGRPGEEPERPAEISVASLSASSSSLGSSSGPQEAGGPAWERFMAHLVAAFREARGPFNEPALRREQGDGEDAEARSG